MPMNDKTDLTALMSAFGRAFHSEKDAAPVFRDKLARELFDDAEYCRMQSYILQGKDFFAPEEQGSEEEILRRIVNGHLAPTPLCRSAFCETALDMERRLGVSYYLDKERIGGLFRALSKLSCEGSALVFDYADQNLFAAEERRVRNMLALACAGGEPMKSCFSSGEIAKMLEQNGFLVYEELLPKQIQQRIIADRCPQMTAFEHIIIFMRLKRDRDGNKTRPYQSIIPCR